MADDQKDIFSKRGNFYKRHKLLVIASTVFIVLSLLLVLTPVLLRDTFSDMLLKLGASQVSIEDVDFNLFTGELVIEKSKYSVPEQAPFNCGQITVNVDVLPLFSDHLFINNVVLDSCDVSIKHPDEKTLLVNGISIPIAAAEEQQAQQTASKSWVLGLHRLSISNVSITYQDSKLLSKFYVEHLSINDVFPWEPDILSTVSLSMKINDAPLVYEGSMKPFHRLRSLTGKLSVTEFDFSKFSPVLDSPSFTLSDSLLTTELDINSALNDDNQYDVKITGFVDNHSFKAQVANSTLANNKFFWKGKLQLLIDKLDLSTSLFTDYDIVIDNLIYSATNKPWTMKIDSVSTQGQFSAAFSESGLTKPHAISKVSINNLLINNPALKLDVAQIGSIDLENLELVNQQHIRMPSLNIRNARIIGQQNDDIASIGQRKKEQYLVNVSELDVKDSQFLIDRQITTASIKLTGLDSQLIKSEDGSIKYLDQLQQTFASTNKAVEPADTTQAVANAPAPGNEATNTKLAVKVGIIETNGNNTFTFKDYSVKPYFQSNLRNMAVKLVSLDSGSPTNNTKISFNADIDESGKINIAGTSQLFSPQLNTDLQGKIKDLELYPLSSYTLPVSGRKIKHGLLDAAISLKIRDRKLNNDNKLVLSSFSVIKDDDKVAKQYDEKMPLPMEMAIDFLKDSKGRIELSVPVNGSLDNPEFSFMPAVAKAIRETMQFAALSYMKYTLQPWGAMIIVGELVTGKMSKVSFEPLLFDPGSKTIDPKQKTYLDKIAKLMQATPKLGLTVCGIATAEDANALKASSTQKPPATPDHQDLTALAQQRAEAVTNYLTTHDNISKERLHACSPTYREQQSAKPSVEFIF